jgi:murein L,D-transpeptidase YafK
MEGVRRLRILWLLLLPACAADPSMPKSERPKPPARAAEYRGPMDGDRAAHARSRVTSRLQELAAGAGLPSPISRLAFIAIKQEAVLEAYGARSDDGPFRLVASWPVLKQSGSLGPKRREGDRQVPEGLYHIDRFNPRSSYYLSLGINYPNASDLALGDPQRPGSDIFIHGGRLSIGCLAMGDAAIEEIYTLADDARMAGQRRIPVMILPFRSEAGSPSAPSPDAAELWDDLARAHRAWLRAERFPDWSVAADGRYQVKD